MRTPELELNSKHRRRAHRATSGSRFKLLLAAVGCGGALARDAGYAQAQNSLAGESAAQALKQSIAAEEYHLRYGPLRFKTGASVGVNYTDNVFYSHDPKDDIMIDPDVTLGAFWPITELNTLRLSLDVSEERYLKNTVLNTDVPLVNPGSELAFNLFVGDFRIRLHERFSYERSLFFNSDAFGGNVPFHNLNDVGVFSRFDNFAGFDVDWDLDKVVLSVSYDHEDFRSSTASFQYLDRASEWVTGSASFALGDHAHAGAEGRLSLHNYQQETLLNDNLRMRAGPFVEFNTRQKISLRAGAGFDGARFDSAALPNNRYSTYYAYGRIRQDTRLFSHSLSAGREHVLGENANNMRTEYVRYAIESPIFAHLDLEANASVNRAEEFGGLFDERFTYYGFGFRVGYQFHKYWRTDVGYEFRLKESDLPLRDFDRNRVTLSVAYSF